jgi:hypothetical protein
LTKFQGLTILKRSGEEEEEGGEGDFLVPRPGATLSHLVKILARPCYFYYIASPPPCDSDQMHVCHTINAEEIVREQELSGFIPVHCAVIVTFPTDLTQFLFLHIHERA